MEVSIIILNYNTFEFTRHCIESVIQFTRAVNYEIILVDNGSTECNPDLFVQEFPSLILIKSPVNKGFAGGNNLGIKISAGEYILLLNSDTLLHEDSVSKCFNAAKADPNIGVISCMLKYPDGSLQKQCQRFPSVFLSVIELFRLHKLIPQPARGKYLLNGFFNHLVNMNTDSVWGTFFMFPRNILKCFNKNELQQDFFMYAEDLLWCYTIKKKGYRIFYYAGTFITHFSKVSSPGCDVEIRQFNEYSFVKKFYGWIYAKLWVIIRAGLFITVIKEYPLSKKIAKIYLNLFFRGKA